MIRLNNDYNQGGCDVVMEALNASNIDCFGGYGIDAWCEKAAALIKEMICRPDADVHFMVGGTQTNYTVIDAALHPYQSVVCADTGHIYCHEGGSIERTGHKVLAAANVEGKLSAASVEDIARAYEESGEADYLTQPKLVFVSSPSEYGTVYAKSELLELRNVCNRYGLYLYLDGARLAYWLACDECDVTLADIVELTDAFYIGGTKCGALFGEALVITNDELKPHFRTLMKQTGGMLAKGWLLGLQFYTLLETGAYLSLARHANEQAMRLKSAFERAGVTFYVDSPTNQQFVLLNTRQMDALAEMCVFEFDHRVDENLSCVRLCTSWSSKDEDIDRLIGMILALGDLRD